MEALIASFGLVAIAEMGDKTQLLSFLLANRFKGRAGSLIAGIFAATVANHLLAAAAGDWVAANVSANTIRWILSTAFIGFAFWALIPDKLDSDEHPKAGRFGPFLTTLVAFFLAEMGDKTQFATVALGASFSNLWLVTIGTTLGMLAANVPAVLLGDRLARYVPLEKMRFLAAAMFAGFGILVLMGSDLGLAGLMNLGSRGS